jgi:hypothetical protein
MTNDSFLEQLVPIVVTTLLEYFEFDKILGFIVGVTSEDFSVHEGVLLGSLLYQPPNALVPVVLCL